MSRAEHLITRSPELATALAGIMVRRKLSVPQLVQRAGVSYRATRLILYPNYRADRGVVSKEKCASVIAVVAPTPRERIGLLGLAGIETFLLKRPDESSDLVVELL